jgi:hypothetical protein
VAEADLTQQGGLTGWVASVIESLGEVGVGLLVALENLIPPIPSEIVLSMAGYLAHEGRVNLVLVYLAATIGLAVGGTRGRLIALTSCTIELAGVLIVGTLSIFDEAAFPDATVWSGFGSGYGYVPLVLPLVGLWWLWRNRPGPR